MSEQQARDVTTIPRVGHAEAMRIAAVENRNFAAQLRTLDADDWTKPTDCVLWDVHDVAAHVIGSAAAQTSPCEFLRQLRKRPPTRCRDRRHPLVGRDEPTPSPTTRSLNKRPPHRRMGHQLAARPTNP